MHRLSVAGFSLPQGSHAINPPAATVDGQRCKTDGSGVGREREREREGGSGGRESDPTKQI